MKRGSRGVNFVFCLGFLVLFLSGALYAQNISIPTNMPGLQGGCAGTLLNLDPPPFIYDVKIAPEAPKAGEEVTVSAAIANDKEKTDSETQSAWLHFSADGGKTVTNVDMEKTENKDAKGHEIWSAKIPGQDAGKNVLYYVSAQDDISNYSSETFGPSTDGTLPPDKEKGKGPLFAAPVPDEECKDAEAALDIKGVAVGYDDKVLYGAITMREKVDKGTMSPTKINALIIGFLNPDKGEDITKGAALIWAPLAKDAGGAAYGIASDCFAIDARIQQTKQPVPDSESGAQCVADGNTLYFKINRALFGSNPSGIIRYVALAGQINTIDISALTSSPPVPQDATSHVYNYLRTHSYKVQ